MIEAFILGTIERCDLVGSGSDTRCSFVLASRRQARGGEITTRVACTYWGRRAHSIAPHLLRGKKVAVSGSLQVGLRDGRPHVTCRVNTLEFTQASPAREEELE